MRCERFKPARRPCKHQQFGMGQVVTLALGLFGQILVSLYFESYILRDSASALRVLKDSSDQLVRLSDPTCREARSSLGAVYRQSPQPDRIGLVVNALRCHVEAAQLVVRASRPRGR